MCLGFKYCFHALPPLCMSKPYNYKEKESLKAQITQEGIKRNNYNQKCEKSIQM